MRNKIILIGCLFFVVVLMGIGCNKQGNNIKVSQSDMENFFKKYCDVYINKYQARDLKSYGIEVGNNMEVGYYKDVSECVKEMLKSDQLSEDACKQYKKNSDQDCNKARASRQATYKKQMTKKGCLENGKNNRCFMWDTTQSRWQGANAGQISSAKAQYTECLQKVDYACADLPESW